MCLGKSLSLELWHSIPKPVAHGARGERRSCPEPPLHLHQKSTCWKPLVTKSSRFPFSFLGSTSTEEGSGLLELARARVHRRKAKKPSETAQGEDRLDTCPGGRGVADGQRTPTRWSFAAEVVEHVNSCELGPGKLCPSSNSCSPLTPGATQ